MYLDQYMSDNAIRKLELFMERPTERPTEPPRSA
jgi:hypothetical protein